MLVQDYALIVFMMSSKRRADEDVSSTSDSPSLKKHLSNIDNHDAQPSSSASSARHDVVIAAKTPLSAVDEKYFRAYSDLLIHQDMISDNIRTNTYKCSIIQNFTSFYNKTVLDVGCGTGILSLFCVNAGAKKGRYIFEIMKFFIINIVKLNFNLLYAVDASPIIHQTRKIIQSNNAENKIVVIEGKIEDVELPEKVDIIVSEWMGYMLFYESMLPSVLHARDKWLKESGAMFPNSAKLFMAPISDFETFDDRVHFWSSLKDMYNVDLSAVKDFAKQKLIEMVHIKTVNDEDIQAHKVLITELDLMNTTVADVTEVKVRLKNKNCLNIFLTISISSLQTPFEFHCFGHNTIHGFVLWFSVAFPGNFILSTSPYDSETHWQQTILYVNPFPVKQDTIISGLFSIQPNNKNPRFQNITVHFQVDNGEKCIYEYVM
uniref:Protein arginine N-methyltransferase 6 n=1 Tax=Strigamia maritima TaxID=126957 RepID=T1IJL5_STRMM